MKKELSSVIFGFSEKKDLSMKGERVNKKRFLEKEGLGEYLLAEADLSNGKEFSFLENTQEDLLLPGVDALITEQKGLILTVTMADCLALYFYDEFNKIIALVHAGWRGLHKGIIFETSYFLKKKNKGSEKHLKVAISPHIQDCHFMVQDDLIAKFQDNYPESIIYRGEQQFINLSLIAKKQLLAQGILNNNIEISSDCTYCQEERYFSYRREREEGLKTMLAYILMP